MAKKWYVVHTNTGFEEKVKEYIERKVKMEGFENLIEEVLVPMETVIEAGKKGKKKTSKRKFFPGYILVKMELNDRTWHFIREVPKVIGFVGGRFREGRVDTESVPVVDEEEVARIKTQIEEGTLKPRPSVMFEKGETVKVVEGPFSNFTGVIDEVNVEKTKVQVLVNIFGRATPIELDFNQVEKV